MYLPKIPVCNDASLLTYFSLLTIIQIKYRSALQAKYLPNWATKQRKRILAPMKYFTFSIILYNYKAKNTIIF
jgi:hypothetical protein